VIFPYFPLEYICISIFDEGNINHLLLQLHPVGEIKESIKHEAEYIQKSIPICLTLQSGKISSEKPGLQVIEENQNPRSGANLLHQVDRFPKEISLAPTDAHQL